MAEPNPGFVQQLKGFEKRLAVTEEVYCGDTVAPDLTCTEIIPRLLFASADFAEEDALLKEHHVTHVLNMASVLGNLYRGDFRYLRVDVDDVPETDLSLHFDRCFAFLEEGLKEGTVLVHGNNSVSVSPSIIVAFLMRERKMSFLEAMELVRSKRPHIDPNPGFIGQLRDLEVQLLRENFQTDRHKDLRVAEVAPALILGSQDVAENLELLTSQRVSHVLNIATFVPNYFPKSFVYHKVNIPDVPETQLSKVFGECFKFMEEGRKHGVILVHCNSGRSRAPTVAVAYLMKTSDLTFREAYDLVASARNDIEINPGFIHQLKDFEKSIHKNGQPVGSQS